MTDIVYILGPGSKWNDSEIMYSIRSLKKHVKNYGDIWIVGHKPRVELDLPTRFIPLVGKKAKQANIRDALKTIAQTPEVSEKFMYMNDDFFFTQPLDADTMPNYYCGLLGPRAANYSKESEGYWRTIIYTWAVLSSLGYATRDYEVHGPINMEKTKLLSTLTLPGTEPTLQIRSIYANVQGGPIKYLGDTKIGLKADPNLTKEKFLKLIENRPFFSIGDELSPEIKAIFEELYPKGEYTYAPTVYAPAVEKANLEFAYEI